jgi:hypothetical protein
MRPAQGRNPLPATITATIDMKLKTCIFILLIILSTISFGQNTELFADSLEMATDPASDAEPDDTFYMAGLATMTMFFMIVFFVLVIVGLILACILLAIFSGLVMAGIVSTSLVVGLYKKSFQKGFKLLIVLTSMFLSSIATTVVFVIVNKIMHWFIVEVAIVGGLILGALSGLVCGLVFFRLLKLAVDKLTTWLKDKNVMAAGNSAQPPVGQNSTS